MIAPAKLFIFCSCIRMVSNKIMLENTLAAGRGFSEFAVERNRCNKPVSSICRTKVAVANVDIIATVGMVKLDSIAGERRLVYRGNLTRIMI